MKVAYIVGGLPFGGVENWLHDLCLALADDPAIEPLVINVSGTGVLMEKYREAGIPVISIGDSKSSINTHRLDTVCRLRRVLKREQVDVIHTLHFSGNYFGRLASIGLGLPVIVHIRNIKSDGKARRVFFNKVLSRFTTMFLAVSKAVVSTIRRDHNVGNIPVEVLYNAVDPVKLDVPAIDLQKEYGISGKVVVGVGRVVKQKNFDRLMRAVGIVRNTVPNVSLVILGDGSEMDNLKALRAELGLEDCVVLAGYQPNHKVPGFLRASHLLAMPSDYEGLPVTHVEALFCGLPAVISEHVPSKEIAGDAALICTTDVEDIAAKMLEVLSNDEKHAAMKKAALDIAPEFSMQNYLKKLKSVYERIV